MLLAQKSYAEGSLALASTLPRFLKIVRQQIRLMTADAALLLDFLTPIVKSYPSCMAVSATISRFKYSAEPATSETIPEQLYRDQRLNPIHEDGRNPWIRSSRPKFYSITAKAIRYFLRRWARQLPMLRNYRSSSLGAASQSGH